MNEVIATGHIMRCIAIAEEARDNGIDVIFVTADEKGKGILEEKGFEQICLWTKWNHMDEELERWDERVCVNKNDIIIVDSYFVTKIYMERLKKKAVVVYIDDLGEDVYPCDILICYANYFEKFALEKRYPQTVKKLLGCEYFPLRKQFKKNCSNIKNAKEILLLTGGTDTFHVTKKILKKCGFLIENMGWHLTAICGKYNEDYEELKREYLNYSSISIEYDVKNIEMYMKKSQIAISAAGTALYELCACGVAVLCYTIADNQKENAISFSKDGKMIYIGDVRENAVMQSFYDGLESILNDDVKRDEMRRGVENIVDGNGCKRIIKELERENARRID